MTTITISVDNEIEQQFRKYAQEIYEGKKGFLGDAITQAMKEWLEQKKQQNLAEQAITQWKKGHKLGKLLYTKREELYGR
ncbi:MAG: hypothetical protein A2729_03515 [Candidatus Buchananbacteria bacterium RIFCSPHIGHO2_01_FULL_39_14]|uniref:XACb0070 ribbon-helix-helix domain-containing protein n=1 Tax=Candidatus Buchananbacteria bacterium RIFCSPHIGHO2_01_FULL_39_14 TaxID=1797532 RepID=A0A1G1XWX1_9BACT|nr:MAG: hypothetical protein A2729_03515 [Candidatus Buchananbacteria bacterium RIFCSPHIGHO2_01_FULL_39_14]